MWVVAPEEADTRAPWIDVPTRLGFEAFAGSTATQSLAVTNHGTGLLSVTDAPGTVPGPGFEVVSVPAPLPPGGRGEVLVVFHATEQASVLYEVGCDDPRAGTAPGHNGYVVLDGRVVEIAIPTTLPFVRWEFSSVIGVEGPSEVSGGGFTGWFGFTVINNGTADGLAVLQVEALEAAEPGWFRVSPASQHVAAGGGVGSFEVSIDVPPDAAEGKYAFRAHVGSSDGSSGLTQVVSSGDLRFQVQTPGATTVGQSIVIPELPEKLIPIEQLPIDTPDPANESASSDTVE